MFIPISINDMTSRHCRWLNLKFYIVLITTKRQNGPSKMDSMVEYFNTMEEKKVINVVTFKAYKKKH